MSTAPRIAFGAPLVFTCALALAAPPFSGTAFLHPAIIVESDPTAFETLGYAGRGMRTMFDRRAGTGDDSYGSGDWVALNAYLFDAGYHNGRSIEVQINPEFETVAAAEREARFYARRIGQLPAALRERIETVWIHKGDFSYGGGNNNILIHVGKTPEFLALGALEEVLMHEAVHTSLDPVHRMASGWVASQAADGEFISDYAEEYPETEDLAETFVPFFAAEYRADRIPPAMAKTIRETIPNRIAYLKGLGLDMRPAAPHNGGQPPDPDPGPPPAVPDGPCVARKETLCLHGARYEVRVEWWTGDGGTGPAKVVGEATDDSGLFRFFDADNWEFLVKVLDGCVVNGHYWVYGASTTNLGYVIRVADTAADTVQEYRNDPGRSAAAITDAEAFPNSCSP